MDLKKFARLKIASERPSIARGALLGAPLGALAGLPAFAGGAGAGIAGVVGGGLVGALAGEHIQRRRLINYLNEHPKELRKFVKENIGTGRISIQL